MEKKTGKGIKKSVTKKKIRHDNFKTCLFDKKQTKASINQIRSHDHEIYSIKLNKIALSSYDDKCSFLEDGVNALAHGHYKIRKINYKISILDVRKPCNVINSNSHLYTLLLLSFVLCGILKK